jgi:uncharacterized protein (DUF2267 family)
MSANGLEVFDRTLQITNIWLDEIMAVVGPDRRLAWKVLSVVLHKLRDRLPLELSAHLGAQLPLLVRGVYYDQFQPGRVPSHCRNLAEFTDEVAEWLTEAPPVDPKDAVCAVFGVIGRHVSAGEVAKVKAALPAGIRAAFDDAEGLPTRSKPLRKGEFDPVTQITLR